MKMKRIMGIVLIAVGALSLAASLAGLFEIWAVRQPATDAALAGVNLFADTLDTTSDALTVTAGSLQSASDTVVAVERTALTAAQTMSATRTTLGSFSILVGRDLPSAFDSSRSALKSAQSSAVVVDNVLAAVSRVPLLNIQYNPAVPLNVTLGDVARSLDNLPSTFSTIDRNLNSTADSLDQVVTSLNALPKTTQQAQRNIADAQQVVARYQGEVDGLQKLSKSIRASLPAVLTAITVGLTFVVFWLGMIQLQVLLKGLELLRGDHK